MNELELFCLDDYLASRNADLAIFTRDHFDRTLRRLANPLLALLDRFPSHDSNHSRRLNELPDSVSGKSSERQLPEQYVRR